MIVGSCMKLSIPIFGSDSLSATGLFGSPVVPKTVSILIASLSTTAVRPVAGSATPLATAGVGSGAVSIDSAV